MYWITGYAFALGPSSNAFISHSRFFLMDATENELMMWYWHFALASMFIIIVNGGFVERLRFWIYPLLALLLGGKCSVILPSGCFLYISKCQLLKSPGHLNLFICLARRIASV